MVVRLPCNERVGGSIPSIGSIASVGVMANRHIRNVVFPVQVWAGAPNAAVAQLVVHFHGKEKVMGSFPIGGSKTECSSAWPERLLWEQNVGGPNPSTPTIFTDL